MLDTKAISLAFLIFCSHNSLSNLIIRIYPIIGTKDKTVNNSEYLTASDLRESLYACTSNLLSSAILLFAYLKER